MFCLVLDLVLDVVGVFDCWVVWGIVGCVWVGCLFGRFAGGIRCGGCMLVICVIFDVFCVYGGCIY